MTNANLSIRPTQFITDNIIKVSLVVSVFVHALFIFGISFSNQTIPTEMMKEVADVFSKNKKIKKDTDYFATSSQEGSGILEKKQQIKNVNQSPLNDSQINQMSDVVNQQKQQTAAEYMQSYLRTTLSIEKINQENDNDAKKDKEKNDAKEQEDRILTQIATLEAEIGRRERIHARTANVKTLTSAIDSSYTPDASYVNRFRKRVEKVGNDHYSKKSQIHHLHGDVRLMVVISPNGQLKGIQLLSSSGSDILDDFAKNSVRWSAPFGKFTDDMTASELRLIRTWRFTNVDTFTTLGDDELKTDSID